MTVGVQGMSFSLIKSPMLAGTLLLGVAVSGASTQTEDHPKPIHHKAHKAAHHDSSRASHPETPKPAGQREAVKVAHPETSKPAAQREALKAAHPETPKPANHNKKSRKKRVRGQQAIDGERARQIQEALVRERYMHGEPSGSWDSATQEAMRRYQADQGWQSKTVPDSRALIRLGLGPDHGHLLNPESAMIADPQLPHGTRTASQQDSSQNSGPAIQAASSPGSMAAPTSRISPSH
jgi:Putative peptidoglycan binding domain